MKSATANRRLFRLLATLTRPEYTRLGKFLRSPFFNAADPPRRLYAALKPHFPNFLPERLVPAALWTKVYPERPFRETGFWRLCSDLSKLVERFLVEVELERQPQRASLLGLKGLARRSDYVLFQRAYHQFLEKQDRQPLRDATYFIDRYTALELAAEHPARDRYRSADSILEELMRHHRTYAELKLLYLGILVENRNRVFGLAQRADVRQEVTGMTQNPEQLAGTALLAAYSLARNPDVLLSRSDVDNLLQNMTGLGLRERQVVYFNLLNTLIRQYNQGNVALPAIIVVVYNYGIDTETVFVNHKIRVGTVINMVIQACLAGEIGWGRDAMHKVRLKLPDEHKADLELYANGIFDYYEGYFEDALHALDQIDFRNVLISILARNLVVRICWERFVGGDVAFGTVLELRINSFRQFLYRLKRMDKRRIEGQLYFLRLVEWLFKQYRRQGKLTDTDNEYILNYMARYPNTTAKRWFMEIVKEEGTR